MWSGAQSNPIAPLAHDVPLPDPHIPASSSNELHRQTPEVWSNEMQQ
jgi:hypothetical protein